MAEVKRLLENLTSPIQHSVYPSTMFISVYQRYVYQRYLTKIGGLGLGRDLAGGWFEYRTRVQPHHTDYAGIAWHGTYVAWLEEARIAYLEAHDSSFSDWIGAGVDLPVVDLALRYHRALPLGAAVLIQTRFEPSKGVRLVWNYQILNADTQDLCVTAQVTLVPVDMDHNKILRSLPPALADWVAKVQPPSEGKT